MIELYEEVLKYCSTEYNYIVFRGIDDGFPNEPEFWTLEKNEEDAASRVLRETDAYDSHEYQFFYKKLIRVEEGPFHHRPTIEIVTKVDW